MTRFVVAVAALCLLTAESQADQPDLNRRLAPTIRSLAKTAVQAEHARLLVVARPMKGSTLPATTLPNVRSVVKKVLEDKGLVAVESIDAAQSLGATSDRKLLDADDVATLQQDLEFDALVTIDVRRAGKRITLRIALIDEERRRFVRTVRLADVPQSVVNPLSNQPKNGPNSGSGLAGALSSIPPLTKGSSGYRKTGTNTGTPSTASSNQPAAETVGDGGPTIGKQQKTSALNQAIVRFAVGQLGKQVGNGECWTLAADALEAAGAQPPRLYDFGEEIKTSEITPGDILQFTSARFDRPDGSYVIMGVPNHTAVVYALNGKQVFVLHQNFGQRIVTVLDIRFENMTSGSVQAYRALPKN